MEIFFSIVVAIALIPASLYLYATLSCLFQELLNPNYDHEIHKMKWRLNTTPVYIIFISCVLSFLNMAVLQSAPIDVVLSFVLIVGCYCYLGSLIKYHYKSLMSKLY